MHHWIHGEANRLSNTLRVCALHHRVLHEGGFRVETGSNRPGRPTSCDPLGRPIPEVPPEMSIDGRPVARTPGSRGDGALVGEGGAGQGAADERREGRPGGENTGTSARSHRLPRWEIDVPLEFYLRALDALGT